MSAWFSRLFRSRAETLAEKAEVDGRFEEAARLFMEAGARAEAFRVLMRAAEASRDLSDRRNLLARAYTVAPTDELRTGAKRALAVVTLAECEESPPSTEERRRRLSEAAADLEESGAFRDAGRAYRILGDRAAVERVLMLAGDVEAYEKEAGAEHAEERYRLRRRNAIESFEASWRSGDRTGAIQALSDWLRSNDRDLEAKSMLDEHAARLVSDARFEARLDGAVVVVVGAPHATFGREGDVVVRGASVSREHCVMEWHDEEVTVRDNGSRNGTQLEGIPIAGAVPIVLGQHVTLGADLSLEVKETDASCTLLEIDRGMDRGRRIALVKSAWQTPLGRVRFADRRAVLEPNGAVTLSGQKVVVPITLARGDRIERDGTALEIVR